ncbi:hypothetical protein L7F22_042412 [Adiantum nelumboides]|nr:hypothetical protein [Adiantum nelumboides]
MKSSQKKLRNFTLHKSGVKDKQRPMDAQHQHGDDIESVAPSMQQEEGRDGQALYSVSSATECDALRLGLSWRNGMPGLLLGRGVCFLRFRARPAHQCCLQLLLSSDQQPALLRLPTPSRRGRCQGLWILIPSHLYFVLRLNMWKSCFCIIRYK